MPEPGNHIMPRPESMRWGECPGISRRIILSFGKIISPWFASTTTSAPNGTFTPLTATISQQRATGNQIDITGGKPASTAARPSEPWYLTASVNTNISTNSDQRLPLQLPAQLVGPLFLGGPPASDRIGRSARARGRKLHQRSRTHEPGHSERAYPLLGWQGPYDPRRCFLAQRAHISSRLAASISAIGTITSAPTMAAASTIRLSIGWAPALGCSTCAQSGMDMTGYAPAGVSSKWIRDYGIILGVPGVDQIAYTRTGAHLDAEPANTPASDKSTIPFYNLYMNDSWRVKPTLTLSYGLGWALEMPPKEEQGKQIAFVDNNDKIIDTAAYLKSRETAALAGQVFNPNVGFALIGNVAGHPSNFYNPFYKSFSPRIAAGLESKVRWGRDGLYFRKEPDRHPWRIRYPLRPLEWCRPGFAASVGYRAYSGGAVHQPAQRWRDLRGNERIDTSQFFPHRPHGPRFWWVGRAPASR